MGNSVVLTATVVALIKFVSLTEHLINEFSVFREIEKPILHCQKWNLPIEY